MLVKLNLRPYFQTNGVCSYKMCGVLFNRHAVILPSAHQSNTISNLIALILYDNAVIYH